MKCEKPCYASNKDWRAYIQFRWTRTVRKQNIPSFIEYQTLYRKGQPLHRFTMEA